MHPMPHEVAMCQYHAWPSAYAVQTTCMQSRVLLQGPTYSAVQMSYVGSVVRCYFQSHSLLSPTTCTFAGHIAIANQLAMHILCLRCLSSPDVRQHVKQGLANSTASGRRLLLVVDTITVYYVLANVPANESDSLSSILETNASQAQFKALLITQGNPVRCTSMSSKCL